MTSGQVLKIIGCGDTLTLCSTEKVLSDTIDVVSERDFDGSLESVNVPVVACTLVRLVLLHEWDQLFSRPALGLEVVVVGSRGSGVHLWKSTNGTPY